jgi:signal transduction histidine kinase
MGGRLIEAQEKERSRIARELHDNICQRLALLALELDQPNISQTSGSTAPRSAVMSRRSPTNYTRRSWITWVS